MKTLFAALFTISLTLLALVTALFMARQKPFTAQWLVFQAYEQGQWNYYRMAPDGSRIKRLTPDYSGKPLNFQGISDDAVYFYDWGTATLQQVSVHGYQPRIIYDEVSLNEVFAIQDDWLILQHWFSNTLIGLYNGTARWRVPTSVAAIGFALSPDGQWLLYIDYSPGNSRLYKMHIDGTDAQAVLNTADDLQYVGWLDGDLLVHAAPQGPLLRVSLATGEITPILESVDYRLLDISGDDLFYVAPDKPGLMRRHMPTGEEWLVVTVDDDHLADAVVLGQWVYYAILNEAQGATLYRVRYDGQFPQKLHEDTTSYRFLGVAPDGSHGVYTSETQAIIFTSTTTNRLPLPAGPLEFKLWSPDGQWLYFDTGTYQHGAIIRISADGTALEWLVVGSGEVTLLDAGPVQNQSWHRDRMLAIGLTGLLAGAAGPILQSRRPG